MKNRSYIDEKPEEMSKIEIPTEIHKYVSRPPIEIHKSIET